MISDGGRWKLRETTDMCVWRGRGGGVREDHATRANSCRRKGEAKVVRRLTIYS